MTEPMHTRGPWVVQRQSYSGDWVTLSGSAFPIEFGSYDAAKSAIDACPLDGASRAITLVEYAAADLLEALEAVLPHVRLYQSARKPLEKARAAIAKAKGE